MSVRAQSSRRTIWQPSGAVPRLSIADITFKTGSPVWGSETLRLGLCRGTHNDRIATIHNISY